ncbi:MAG: hypothetical protein ABIQ16_17995, partial [Polyangiaceae bacterium]
GVVDEFGGLLTFVDQSWWKHPARKRTGLYFVRCRPRRFPFSMERAERTVESQCGADRERTPWRLAVDLVRAARSVQ